MANIIKPKTQIGGRRKKLEQDLAHVTQEMYRRNKELVDINRTLSLLRTIDNLVLSSRESLQVLTEQIASSIVATTEYPFVGILAKPQSHPYHKDIQLYGWSGSKELQSLELEDLKKIKINPNHRWLKGKDKSALVHLEHMPAAKIAEYLGCTTETINSLKTNLPLKALYVIKLQAREGLIGLMVIGFDHSSGPLDHSATALLERLGEAVGIAIDSKLLFEENQYVLKQLRTTNQKLRELDETKDEFISMASHQLRTPLTSVKGYVSMVLEGDTGKINKQQKTLLDQAFISSQRMVYLIADLLNVSRLKTGKFVIQRQPTQLADVIEGELSQLYETAKGRGLELIYKKPAKFPLLMLDETKIRQVVMNFVDNAIYYTPSGGHIHVNLEDKGDSVEFTVVDDGIGVPKKEQHQLFTKFFRAGNAQKARPDGTGLGLFMAQKVIVAQGGAIIFHSEEGKGSTFGFSFAKKKLLATGKEKTESQTSDIPL